MDDDDEKHRLPNELIMHIIERVKDFSNTLLEDIVTDDVADDELKYFMLNKFIADVFIQEAIFVMCDVVKKEYLSTEIMSIVVENLEQTQDITEELENEGDNTPLLDRLEADLQKTEVKLDKIKKPKKGE